MVLWEPPVGIGGKKAPLGAFVAVDEDLVVGAFLFPAVDEDLVAGAKLVCERAIAADLLVLFAGAAI